MASIIKFARTTPKAKMPSQGYEGDAGHDLYVTETTEVQPHSTTIVSTGIRAAFPNGFWAQIISRSSTPRKFKGLQVVEAVIDQGYRGELFIQVANPSKEYVTIPEGSRIAQLVLHRIYQVKWEEVEELPKSERGQNGFGSSDK